jgi:hypothetical protein
MDGLNSIWWMKARFDGPDEKGAKKVPKEFEERKKVVYEHDPNHNKIN